MDNRVNWGKICNMVSISDEHTLRELQERTKRAKEHPRPTINKPATTYKVIQREGNDITSFRAYANGMWAYNRAAKIITSKGIANKAMLAVLFTLEAIQHARGDGKAYAVRTAMQNHCTPFQKEYLFVSYLQQMQLVGLVHLEWSGKVAGSKVAITPLGTAMLLEIYQETISLLSIFPRNK